MIEQWDGRPQNPERDGWHWLMQDALLYPARWDAAASAWHRSRFLTPAEIARLNDYCGPCLTPAEIERLRTELATIKQADDERHQNMLDALDKAAEEDSRD